MGASVGDRLGTTQTQDVVLILALGLGAYLVYKIFGIASAVAHATGAAASAVVDAAGNAYTTTVSALGSGLYTLFGPDDAQALGSMTYLMVTFPNGGRHAIPANTVSSAGLFNWSGYPAGSERSTVLTLVKDQTGKWFATSDTPMALAPSELTPIMFDPNSIDPTVVVN